MRQVNKVHCVETFVRRAVTEAESVSQVDDFLIRLLSAQFLSRVSRPIATQMTSSNTGMENKFRISRLT
jgi:hypothetical protein